MSATVDGTELVLTYHENLDTGSVPNLGTTSYPPRHTYTVFAGEYDRRALSNVSVAGKTVTLTLDAAVTVEQNVTIRYDRLASTTPVQDVSGIGALSFGTRGDQFPVTNISPAVSAALQELELQDDSGTALKLTPTFHPPETYEAYPSSFEPRVDYKRTVSHGTTVANIFAKPKKDDGLANIEYRRSDGMGIGDADMSKEGRQVALWGYANPVEIKVTSTARTVTIEKTYTLMIRVAGVPTQEPATGKPRIVGTAHVGETLSVDMNDVTDANGTYLAETRWNRHGFSAVWEIDNGDPNTHWIIGSGKTVTLDKNIYAGKQVYVEIAFKDDLGNSESRRSDVTAVGGLAISNAVGRLDGSRCDYVFPAGAQCVDDSQARNIGERMTVVTGNGANVTSRATFSVASSARHTVFDENGNEQEWTYEFAVTSGGQLRTVADKTYPHMEWMTCTRLSYRDDECVGDTIKWYLAPVEVEVTATLDDGRSVTERFSVWVVPHPDAVPVTEPTDLRCDGKQCYGRKLVPGEQLYAPDTSSRATYGSGPPLTVAFRNGPDTHDGESGFTVEAVFSEAPVDMDNLGILAAMNVSGGTKVKVRRVQQNRAHRRVWIRPDGPGPVTVSFAPTLDCADAHALCTAAGGKLESPVAIQIAGPPPVVAATPLTARFENVPDEHKGKKRLDIEIVFSEPPVGGKTAVVKALSVTRGAKWGVRPVGTSTTRFNAAMRPYGFKPIVVTLAATSDCADTGALCTTAGGKLESPISTTILGPVAISVADARVEEAVGAMLEFAVTLDRTRASAVSVDYATADGSATAGDDYTAASGTLTFAPGETTKTIQVAVLDDAHDEGEETMVLRLSNPTGGRIADGEATGTIENTDAMPKAWLARFGRTVAEQVVDAAEQRIRATPQRGNQLTIAGQTLRAGNPKALANTFETLERANATNREPEARTLKMDDLLTGSSFSLTAGDDSPNGALGSVWGRGAISSFDGREGDLRLDGEVTTGMLGLDFSRERWSAGAMLAHTRGDGTYQGADRGTVESELSGLYPYGRYALNDRVTAWGVAGYGTGTLGLTPEGKDTLDTDIDLVMGAIGLRGVVTTAPATGGAELAVTTDALGVRTTSAAVRNTGGAGNLAATEADVTRLRLGLESSWHGATLAGGPATPRLELGLRHDGGDAETGFGIDVGGAFSWSNEALGLRADIAGRGLLTHESSGFRDQGFSGSLAFDPRPRSERGLALSLRQSVGASAAGGVDALLGRETLAGLSEGSDGDELARGRLELRVGYGVPAFGGGFTATPEFGLGLSENARDVSLGWRLGLARSSPASLEFRLEGTRREAEDEAPKHEVGLGVVARW